MPAWLDQVLGDPPAKPSLPPWLSQVMQPSDATSVARTPRPQLPQPTIGPLAVQNRRPGGKAIPAPQPRLPVDDQGVFGSGQGQGLFDVLPGLGAARGVKAGVDVAKAGHLPLGLLLAVGSILPEGGVLAEKLGAKVITRLAESEPERIVAAAFENARDMKTGQHIPGTMHGDVFMKAQDAGLPIDDESLSGYGEPGFLTNRGRFVSREEAGKIALQAKQVGEPHLAGSNGKLVSEYVDFPEPPAAPAVVVPSHWKPTERGVFDRRVPAIQGTAAIDPRMIPAMKKATTTASPLADAIAHSKTVERGLLADTEKGLPFGGDQWYETGPIKAYYEQSKGPMTFQDWLNASGAGSIQNPTHNEPASASILLYAKRHGISVPEAMDEFARRFPDAPTPWMSQGHIENFARADQLGGQFPMDPSKASRKVPWYTHGKQGGSLAGEVALDTHERRRLVQLAGENNRLAKLLRESGITNVEGPKADVVPIKNALDYATLSSPYQRIAQKLGLPSAQAAQAGRWLGGGSHTGLASQPFGDYVQTLEDGLLYTARTRGLDERPRGLRSLWDRIAHGEDFFMPLYSRKGGYPVY